MLRILDEVRIAGCGREGGEPALKVRQKAHRCGKELSELARNRM